VVGADLGLARPHGPFHLILDSIGGSALAACLTMLAPGGTCVHFGVSEASTARFESRDFFTTGGARLYGLSLFHELRRGEPAAEGLALLARLVAAGTLDPQVEIEAPWTEIGSVARRLIDRAFPGKAVLHLA
jgi:NADPH:quinone reductase-like Zn-dependent oxidoreductase